MTKTERLEILEKELSGLNRVVMTHASILGGHTETQDSHERSIGKLERATESLEAKESLKNPILSMTVASCTGCEGHPGKHEPYCPFGGRMTATEASLRLTIKGLKSDLRIAEKTFEDHLRRSSW